MKNYIDTKSLELAQRIADYMGGYSVEDKYDPLVGMIQLALTDTLDKVQECVPRAITEEEKARDPNNVARKHEIMGYEACRETFINKLDNLRK